MIGQMLSQTTYPHILVIFAFIPFNIEILCWGISDIFCFHLFFLSIEPPLAWVHYYTFTLVSFFFFLFPSPSLFFLLSCCLAISSGCCILLFLSLSNFRPRSRRQESKDTPWALSQLHPRSNTPGPAVVLAATVARVDRPAILIWSSVEGEGRGKRNAQNQRSLRTNQKKGRSFITNVQKQTFWLENVHNFEKERTAVFKRSKAVIRVVRRS